MRPLVVLAVLGSAACDSHLSAGKVATSPDGVVVSQHPIASQVGADMLGRGGNAVDAAVATAFALTVVEPTNSGLGGRTQILIRLADGSTAGIDATNQVPQSYPVDSIPPQNAGSGYGMIGVPGTVAGLTKAIAEHGSLPLAEVMAPSIALARDGFALNEAQASSIARVADQLRQYEGSARYFLKSDGTAYEPGETLVQNDLAETLSRIADGGPDAFYRGPIAAAIAADMAAKGGFVTAQDLANYTARDAMVVRGEFRGHELIGTYLPAAGANTISMLHTLDRVGLSGSRGSAAWASTVGQAVALGFRDRLADLANMGPPATFPLRVNADRLMSHEHAERNAEMVRPFVLSEAGIDTTAVAGAFPPGHTTHLSVVDASGMAVALTQSLGPTMGSKVAAPGLGFMYSATMGYLSGEAASAGIKALGPGDRASSRQSPIMLVNDGELHAVLGGSGSRRIVSALVQVVMHLTDGDLDISAAVAQPRVHVEPSQPDVLHLQMAEARSWDQQVIADLRAFGFDVRDQHTQSFGNISAVARTPDGWMGVADPSGSGAAVANH